MTHDRVEISVLKDLHHSDDSPLNTQSRQQHPPFWGPGQEYLGHEWARWRRDTLDERVDRLLADRGDASLDILDLGCATGVRAVQFAEAGHHVTALDLLDRSFDIVRRNDALGLSAPHAKPIEFVQADLRQLSASRFSKSFDLIHARRVITFLAIEALEDLFATIASLVKDGGFVVVSLIATALDQPGGTEKPVVGGPTSSLPLGPGMHAYHVGEIRRIMRTGGLDVTEVFSDGRVEAGLIARKRTNARQDTT